MKGEIRKCNSLIIILWRETLKINRTFMQSAMNDVIIIQEITHRRS